jgi:anti-sigma regulatory factor (Ser/Thr protein kinase)
VEVPTLGTLRPDARSPREARRLVRELLEPRTGPEVLAEVLLAVSELVTNAVEHAGTAVQLRGGIVDGRVRIEVADGSGEIPRRRQPDLDALGGRGMLLVGHVADDWGIVTAVDGKTVWFERALNGEG